jgi:putative transposase
MISETQQKRLTSLKNTQEKRTHQIARVYELKLNQSHIKKSVWNELNFLFIQAKRVINDMIRFSESNNLFKYNYKDHKQVQVKQLDGSFIEKDITISSRMHQELCQSKFKDISNLSKKKKKGINKIGGLKYKKEVTCIPINTGRIKIKSSKIVAIPGFRKLPVYGLEQFYFKDGYEVADAKLIRKASGIYIKICIMFPKDISFVQKNKSIGIDMGIKNNLVTSEGETINCLVQESDNLKKLQRKMSRQQKGSQSKRQVIIKLKKEYEHLTNKKNDTANKIVYKFMQENDCIYFQDEQLASWSKFAFGKTIQHSVLGRVKHILMQIERETNHQRAVCISKWQATTKICWNCETKIDIELEERMFRCPICGFEIDRDVHAAYNIKKFGSLKRAEWSERSSVDLGALDVSKLVFQALNM